MTTYNFSRTVELQLNNLNNNENLNLQGTLTLLESDLNFDTLRTKKIKSLNDSQTDPESENETIELSSYTINLGNTSSSRINLNGIPKIPNLSINDINNLINPLDGQIVYNTTTKKLNMFSSGFWSDIGNSSVGTNYGDYMYWNSDTLRWDIGSSNIILGSNAGRFNQGIGSIAIGNNAGNNNQQNSCIAIGNFSGYTFQKDACIGIGDYAGYSNQNLRAIAIGGGSGERNQGTNAIAIGNWAGQTNQPSNSIIINASGTGLSGTTASSLYINPIRSIISSQYLTTDRVLIYDINAKEIKSSPITITQLGYLNNVSSDIQSQIDGKQSTISNNITFTGDTITTLPSSLSNCRIFQSGAISSDIPFRSLVFATRSAQAQSAYDGNICFCTRDDNSNALKLNALIENKTGNLKIFNLTSDRVILSGSNKELLSSSITSTELGYLSGLTFNLNTRLTSNNIILGSNSTITNQNSGAIAIGTNAGNTSQGTNAIALGNNAGQINQASRSIAIGLNAGSNNQDYQSIAIGENSGQTNQGFRGIAIGADAGSNNQRSDAIAIGTNAGNNTQGGNSIAIGELSGQNNQMGNAIAIGYLAGQNTQGTYSIAIGYRSGESNKGWSSISLGQEAGYANQTDNAIAIGNNAGRVSQGYYSIAIGLNAGKTNQSESCIAIGDYAGALTQRLRAIAIGPGAGEQNQGTYSIALGNFAGQTNQPANSIVINASGTFLNGTTASSLYINPIRNVTNAGTDTLLVYDATNKEVKNYTTITSTQLNQITYLSGISSNISTSKQDTITTNSALSNILTSNLTASRVNVSDSSGKITSSTISSIELNKLLNITFPQINSVGINTGPDFINQKQLAVAIGYRAGENNQGTGAISIGYISARTNQGTNAISIGYGTADFNQGDDSVSIGSRAGQTSQGNYSIAIGLSAAQLNQSNNCIAIGDFAGYQTQNMRAIAIGPGSGQQNQGTNAIALGRWAGMTNQPANSIVINASGIALSGTTSSSLYINPIRNETNAGTDTLLIYDATNKEVKNYTTISSTELSYLDGVSSNIQSQLDDKQNSITNRIGFSTSGNDDTFNSYPVNWSGANIFQTAAIDTDTTFRSLLLFPRLASSSPGNIVFATRNSSNVATPRLVIDATTGNVRVKNLTPSSVVVSGTNNELSSSIISTTELSYLDGLTFNLNSRLGSTNIIVGSNSDITAQKSGAIAIGYNAGNSNQGTNAIAIGYNASQTNQGENSISIGYNAGRTNQGYSCVSIGDRTGTISQQFRAIAIGGGAGERNQGTFAIGIGNWAGMTNQPENSIILNASGTFLNGTTASSFYVNPIRAITSSQYLSTDTVLVYDTSAKEIKRTPITSTELGYLDGLTFNLNTRLTSHNIILGSNSNITNQGTGAIAIGTNAGSTPFYNATQSIINGNNIAIGNNAGQTSQGSGAIAIGLTAGSISQDYQSIAIGQNSGQTNQSNRCIAIGPNSGVFNQGICAIAIGNLSGQTNQGGNTISIGNQAGNNNQNDNSIAIGINAGQTNQGTNSIAIGRLAGQTNQSANSIVINASGAQLNGTTANSCYIRPIRGVARSTPVLTYDATNFEVNYNTSSIKYKKNVIDLQQDTSVIYNVRPREYDTKEDNLHYIGFIAEELEEIDTNFTWKNPDGTPEGIEWFNMMVYLIEEVKKLKNEINLLKNT